MESPRLRILILGSPVVTWDEVPVKIARQQIRLLLFFLAAQTQPVHRNKISQLLWPEKDDTSAHKLLREALSKLRAALPDSTIVVSNAGEVFLDPQKVYVDAREFKQLTDPLLESVDFSRDAILPGWMYTEMRKALVLCRGKLNLEGVDVSIPGGYENFLNLASQSYDYIRLRIEERLASHCIAIGDLDEAILWLSKALEIDPLNDENNFLLINCLKDCGRTKDALDFINYLENLYIHNTEQPLPKTISTQRARILESHETIEKETPEWPGIEEHPVPFVGRADLLERLRNAFYRKGVVYIRGMSGVGKNRLMEEFYLNLQRKPRLVFCSGKPLVKCAPFEPIMEGLRAAVRPEEWMDLADVYKIALQEIFPDLISDTRKILETDRLDQEKGDFLQICEALHQLLIILAKKRQLLLVVDIILWCDDATIDFLAFLCDRDFFKKHGLLVLCSRKEESNLKVEKFVGRNLIEGNLEQIDVPALTKEETAFLLQKMIGFDVGQKFLEKFYRDTGGNPYFLIEGLKSLLSLKFDFKKYSSTNLYPIPDTIKALIDEKTRGLSTNALRVLHAGAVLGQFFMPEVVENMEDLPTKEMITALEELESFSIISARENPEIGTGYFFDHNQIRETVLQNMSPLRKRHLHLAAVNALTKVFGHKPDLESIYAYHYEEAGEPAKAFNAWLMAAEFARTRFSKSDRYYAYEKAYKLVNRLPQDQLVVNVDALVNNWGDYAFDLTDSATCLKIYNMCLEIGEQTQDPILLADAWNGFSRVHDIKLDFDAGIDAVNRALFYCDRIDHLALKLETLARFAILYCGKNETQKSIEYCEKAMEFETLVKTQREMDAMVNIQVQLGLMYLISGWPKKTVEIGEKALNLSLLVKRRSAKVQAAAVLGAGQYYMGNYQKSLQNSMAVRDLAERLNFRWWLSFLEVLIGRNFLAMGDMDKSWAYCQSALERELPYENNGVYALVLSLEGEIYHLFGDTHNAERMFKKGMTLTVKGYQTLDNLIQYARLKGRNDPKLGLSLFREIIVQAEKYGLGLITLQARLGSCLFSVLEHGYQKSIETEIDEIEKELKERGFSICWLGEYIKAQGAKKSGNREEASIHFRRLLSDKNTTTNVWVNLHGIYGLCSLAESEIEKEKLKKELKAILTKIGENAKLPPLRRWFFIFRKKMISDT